MATPLSHRLRAVSQPSLRLAWFSKWVSEVPLDEAVRHLEELLEDTESFGERGTESLVTVVAWVSGAVAPQRLHALARAGRGRAAFRLGRLLSHAEECPLEVDADISGAIPTYRKERMLTLGERKSLARRPNRQDIQLLLRDPHPAVIKQLLNNPQLTEPDLLRLVTLRPPHPISLCHLFRNVRWLTAPRVRTGLLQNPGLPLWQTIPVLSLCTRPELLRVCKARNVPCELIDAARTRLLRHPPVREGSKSYTVH